MSAELDRAMSGEIDIIFAFEVTDEHVAELDEWSEIGWLLLECGCLASPWGRKFVHEHVKPEGRYE